MMLCNDRAKRASLPVVLYLSAEVAPFSKVGGLGDVAGSLPLALAERGVPIVILTPWYGGIEDRVPVTELPIRLAVPLDGGVETFQVGRAWLANRVPVLLLRSERLFGAPVVYDEPRDRERFFVFSRAAAELVQLFPVGIVHANDWHTALTLVWLHRWRDDESDRPSPGLVLTIHNLAHQGITDIAYARRLGFEAHELLFEEWQRFPGTINVLARGIHVADVITTVSPTYAREIQTPEFGEGLDGLLRYRSDALVGIRNGIDTTFYDPASDPVLAARYDVEHPEARSLCKRALQGELGLAVEPDSFLIGIVSRLDHRKGLDLVLALGDELVSRGMQLAVLGVGEPEIGRQFAALAERYPDRVAVRLTFDAVLARRIYAGADVVLLPSRFEPCGLGQLLGLRYGAIPIVRRTGGLADTVVEWDGQRGNGFLFEEPEPGALLEAIERARAEYREPARWWRLVRSAMSCDVSWEQPAEEYLAVYERVAALRRTGALETVR
ncbi:glycogen synthase [Thermomicrobium roseum]|uniref:Glycogen synthase n=1 Tax=Thermomicrobium roseum (strain ATCC 27502 / DSM 5159 / P-2) TaxID=309801 RepID=B9L1J8_THERP|nr:glycogen/starch synthase [Thermomicrobium roseum]ACM04658.1 glycogen synthase [Thermomicrobium roseum DSM 5159]